MEPIRKPFRLKGIHSIPSEPTKEIKNEDQECNNFSYRNSTYGRTDIGSCTGTRQAKDTAIRNLGLVRWVDKGHRDFSEDDYDTITEMPTVNVTILPATVGRRVILESYSATTKTWSAEKISRTDAEGVAKFRVDPLCDEVASSIPMWCDHDSTYRIRVLKSGTQRQSLSAQFVVSFVTTEIDTF